MKKVMLLIIALLFSISASAASFTLSTYGGNVTEQTAGDATGFPAVTKAWDYSSEPLLYVKLSSTDYTGDINIKWWFSSDEPATASLLDGPIGTHFVHTLDRGIGGYTYLSSINADSFTYLVFNNAPDAYNGTINLEVSAVPVPAAIWLFAPAMLGFIGIRFNRKNRTATSV